MEKLGIEPNLLIAQIVNFLIIMFVLTKLLYKPVLGMLEKRKKEIAEGLALTEKMGEEEEKMKAKKDKLLEEGRKEARNIIDEAKKEAEAQMKDIVADAHKQAHAIVEKGKEDAKEEMMRMKKDVQKAAVDIATAMTKQLVSSILSPADQHKLLQKHFKQLESVKS